MSVVGTWKLTMNTPFGVQTPTLEIKDGGGTLTGTSGAAALEGLQVDGDNVSFTANVATPMGSFPVSFRGTASGNDMKGTYKTMMGVTEFTGVRLS